MHIVWDTLGWLRFQTNLKNHVHSCFQDCYAINENLNERWKKTDQASGCDAGDLGSIPGSGRALE